MNGATYEKEKFFAPSSSQASSEESNRRKVDEVSDIRNRFAHGFTSEKPKSQPTAELKSPQRSSSRGKEFSQLLQKFSTTSDASSSERSDSDLGGPRQRIFIKRQEAREVQSSSDDAADNSRRTPVRTQSLRVRGSSAREDIKEEKGVER
nr:hypothetical protein BaRGS_032691 [Batillaria attramentaria]